MEPFIHVDNLAKSFSSGRRTLGAVDGVSFGFKRSEFISIIGPSGCGKTTLLRLIGGLLEPSRGAIRIGGESADCNLAKRMFGFVFQDPVLMRWRTVAENVRLPLELSGAGPGEEVDALLQLLDLDGFKDSYPHELSGGMQQRVAIARALITRPKILLLDEPFGSLDEITRSRLNLELLGIWQDAQARLSNVILVTHSIQEAILLSDHIVVLSGRPARVKEVVEVGMQRPRRCGDLDRDEFVQLRRRLREHFL